MNAKKKRDKDRRRARKLAEQAWDAEADGNLDLAVKIIRRAVDVDPGNPQLWHDQGLLLRQANDDQGAADAFQAAIVLAADFAEAYANLAEIRIRQGRVPQSIALQREAVKHAPHLDRYRESLHVYEALDGAISDRTQEADENAYTSDHNKCGDEALRRRYPDLAARVSELEWPTIEEHLTRNAFAHVPQLLAAPHCAILRSMFADDQLFSQTVKMNKPRFGKGVYRYFGPPIPDLIDAIRRIVYPQVARIANNWQRLIGRDECYPPDWEEFRRQCADAGQTTPTPLLLRYETGGFNAPHQDIRGEIYFPIQLVIVLSPIADPSTDAADGFTGGEFLLVDQPERKKSDRRAIPAGLGDAVFFCTRARLVHIGGVYGLKPVKHGMERVESGVRHALGIPFHEYQ